MSIASALQTVSSAVASAPVPAGQAAWCYSERLENDRTYRLRLETFSGPVVTGQHPLVSFSGVLELMLQVPGVDGLDDQIRVAQETMAVGRALRGASAATVVPGGATFEYETDGWVVAALAITIEAREYP